MLAIRYNVGLLIIHFTASRAITMFAKENNAFHDLIVMLVKMNDTNMLLLQF